MVRLAALIPLPRHAVQRYHGIFAPNSRLRGAIVPAGAEPSTSRRRAMAKEKAKAAEPIDLSPAAIARAVERTSCVCPAARTAVAAPGIRGGCACRADAWKRAFGRDILACECGGRKRVIAVIQAGPIVDRILAHLGLPVTAEDFVEIRGPPDDMWPVDDEPVDAANDDGIDLPFFDDAS